MIHVPSQRKYNQIVPQLKVTEAPFFQWHWTCTNKQNSRSGHLFRSHTFLCQVVVFILIILFHPVTLNLSKSPWFKFRTHSLVKRSFCFKWELPMFLKKKDMDQTWYMYMHIFIAKQQDLYKKWNRNYYIA